MKILFYSVKDFEMAYLTKANNHRFEISFVEEPLSDSTVALAKGYDAACIFTNDDASRSVIKHLQKAGVRYIAVRAAGYDNVDLEAASEAGIKVANVPEYSPHAIAEHTVAMILALNRKLMQAHEQVHHQDFTIDNLIGFNLQNKKAGIIGTGRIGSIVAKILHGFGCTILAYDEVQNPQLQEYNVQYVSLPELCSRADIITLHVPLTKETTHLINRELIQQMQKGVMLINTARGGVVETEAVIEGLESGQIGYCGMDVYEKEKGLFFYNHNHHLLNDPQLTKLMRLPNVLITPHQAFATREALTNIAETTFYNMSCWQKNSASENELTRKPTPEKLLENIARN